MQAYKLKAFSKIEKSYFIKSVERSFVVKDFLKKGQIAKML